eukprot:6930669-Pyramimonas_sp.AAC.1
MPLRAFHQSCGAAIVPQGAVSLVSPGPRHRTDSGRVAPARSEPSLGRSCAAQAPGGGPEGRPLPCAGCAR